jgi:hypothetical protein
MAMDMKTFLARAILVLAAICSGCATQGVVTPEKAAQLKRVAVVSVAAHRFSRLHVGLTVFGNESERIAIADWNVDAAYRQQLAAALKSRNRFEVVDAAAPREEFLRIYDLNGPWDAPAFRGPNWDAVGKPVRDYCAANGLGAVVLVYATEESDFFGGTNQLVRGAGIYTRGFGETTRVSVLHLLARVAFVDCQTAKPIAVRWLSGTQNAVPGEIIRGSPRMPLPVEIARTPLERLSAEQRATLKSSLAALPADAWSATVSTLFGN